MDIDDSVVTPRPMRQSKPRCCSCYNCFIFTCVLSGVGIAVVMGALMTHLYYTIGHIHDDMFVSEANSAVIPLIDTNITMDIALVVYVRKPNAETSHPDRYAESWSPDDTADKAAVRVSEATKMPVVEFLHIPEDTVVFSDIVATDFSLRQKNRDVKVQFDLPLQRFHDHRIYEHDARAVLLLIPQGETLLDKAVNVTTIWHKDMPRVPRLDDKLRSMGVAGPRGSVREQAIEAMSINIPLIHLYKVEEKDEDVVLDEPGLAGEKLVPYVVNRVQVAIVNETRSIDSAKFLRAFRERQKVDCGTVELGPPGSRWMCSLGSYMAEGLWAEPFLTLPTLDGETEAPLAYTPFIKWIEGGTGPRHYVKLPVNRSKSSDEPSPTPESLTVNLIIRVSSVSPAKQTFMEIQPQGRVLLNLSATESALAHRHDDWELSWGLWNGVADDTHPRRRFVLHAVWTFLDLLNNLLWFLYWSTRQTTTGISRAQPIGFLANWLNIFGKGQSWGMTTFWLLCLLSAYPLLRTMSPLVLEGTGWKRTLRSRIWTHRERASRRRELALPQSLALVLVGTLVLWASDYLQLSFIVRPAFPSQTIISLPRAILHYVLRSVFYTSQILQIYLNHRNRTFAGDFAINALLSPLVHACYFLFLSSRIVGRYDLGAELHISQVVNMALALALAYQALTLPRVEQNVKGEDENEK